MSFDSEVRSKSTNNLSAVLVIENTLSEMKVPTDLVNNMDLVDVKRKLKKIVNGYNKENPLDIYDTSSLNIILKTFLNNNISSYQTSDYYNSISSSSSTSFPMTTSQEDDSSQTSSNSYYPEFLTCLTNFAALCQTLDDCTAINMEITSVDPNLQDEDDDDQIDDNSNNTSNTNSTIDVNKFME